MLDTTELSRLWQSDPRNQCRYPNLTLTPIGVVLGAGTLVIKAVTEHGESGLDITGNEEEILALLSATYGEAISPQVMPHFHGASRWLKKGDRATACIALAHAGLPDLPRRSEEGLRASERLFKAGMLVATQGVTPSQLMVGLGLLPPGVSVVTWRKMAKGYNPDEARDERGRWTDGGGGYSSGGKPMADTASSRSPITLASTRDKMTGEQINAMKEKFIDDHLGDAEAIANKLGVPVENIIALSALESGYGTDKFAVNGNNFFSMHYPAPFCTGYILSADGTKVATFASYEDAARSFAERYGNLVEGVQDPEKFARILQDHGYYGINDDGSKVKHFAPVVAAMSRGLRKRIDRRKA